VGGGALRARCITRRIIADVVFHGEITGSQVVAGVVAGQARYAMMRKLEKAAETSRVLHERWASFCKWQASLREAGSGGGGATADAAGACLRAAGSEILIPSTRARCGHAWGRLSLGSRRWLRCGWTPS
jgi:hypothetical protein